MKKNPSTIKTAIFTFSAILVLALVAGLIWWQGCSLGLSSLCKADDFDPNKTFMDYCRAAKEHSPAVNHTVSLLKAIVRQEECSQAWVRLNRVQAIHLDGKEMQSILPLNGLKNLLLLDIRNNSVTDLRPLASLKSLRSLKLENNEASDLSPLAAMTNLLSLDLTGNPIQDIRALQNLSQLMILRLDDTNVDDISPIRNLKRLEKVDFFRGLSLANTPIQWTQKGSAKCPNQDVLSPAVRDFCAATQTAGNR